MAPYLGPYFLREAFNNNKNFFFIDIAYKGLKPPPPSCGLCLFTVPLEDYIIFTVPIMAYIMKAGENTNSGLGKSFLCGHWTKSI